MYDEEQDDTFRFRVAVLGQAGVPVDWIRDLYHYTLGPSYDYDPTTGERYDLRRKTEVFDDEKYELQATVPYEPDLRTDVGTRELFSKTYLAILLLYDASNRKSLEILESRYRMIPRPPKKPISSESILDSKRLKSHETYILNFDWQFWITKTNEWEISRPLYVEVEKFPIVIAGRKPDHNEERQIGPSDIDSFIQRYPDCKFAGEFTHDSIGDVDDIFRYVIGIIHELKKTAIRDPEAGTAPVTESSRRARLMHGFTVLKRKMFH